MTIKLFSPGRAGSERPRRAGGRVHEGAESADGRDGDMGDDSDGTLDVEVRTMNALPYSCDRRAMMTIC